MMGFLTRFCMEVAVILSLYEIAIASPFPDELVQQAPMNALPSTEPLKVPGHSAAYYCSDPSDDIFRIDYLDFIPTNPRVGYYQYIRFIGGFVASTGDVPWLNITGSINGRPELGPLYYSPLCDIDVIQFIKIPVPGGGNETERGLHRSCPPSIQEGYAEINSPGMPLQPDMVPTGRWDVRAEAQTQDGRRIFCVEGSFDVTT